MIEDAPLLTVRRCFARPAPEKVAALHGLQTGVVVDCLGGRGALAGVIRPVDLAAAGFCGVAVPCHTGPGDNLAFYAALEMAGAGDVIVIATDGFAGTAVIGDLALGMAKNRGVVGVVTDGCVRDLVGIRAVSLPCHAAGVTPNSPARNGPGSAGLPVTLGGVTVSAGDVVLGDQDGVVVLPQARIDEALARLPGVQAAEAALEAEVKAGLEIPAFVSDLLQSDRVREL